MPAVAGSYVRSQQSAVAWRSDHKVITKKKQPNPSPRAEQNVWRGRQRWQQITRMMPKWSAAQGNGGASSRGSGNSGDADSSATDLG